MSDEPTRPGDAGLRAASDPAIAGGGASNGAGCPPFFSACSARIRHTGFFRAFPRMSQQAASSQPSRKPRYPISRIRCRTPGRSSARLNLMHDLPMSSFFPAFAKPSRSRFSSAGSPYTAIK